MQEAGEALFDLLGFGLRAGEPEQVIVGVAEVPEPGSPGSREGRPRRCWRSARTAARSPRRRAAAIALATLVHAGLAFLLFPRVYSGMRTVSANLSSRSR